MFGVQAGIEQQAVTLEFNAPGTGADIIGWI
jgi:hypothetical protein